MTLQDNISVLAGQNFDICPCSASCDLQT